MDIPSVPATEEQKRYATARSVTFPQGITKAELHELLNRRRDRDEPASDQIRAWATRRNVSFTRYVGHVALLDRIETGGCATNLAHAEFFVWRVIRSMTAGEWQDPADSSIDPAWVAGAAAALVADPKAMRSAKTHAAKEQRERGGGGKPTSAYAMVSNAVREGGPLPRLIQTSAQGVIA